MSHHRPGGGAAWPWIAAVFAVVLGADLLAVAAAGTDIPFHDQWGVEGAWLYPRWLGGELNGWYLLQPVNEHRILWTHLLNVGLFTANGQWDPLVQLGAIGLLRAGFAAGLMACGAQWLGRGGLTRSLVAVAVGLAFLPFAGWHNVLWGFESSVQFVLAWSGLALGLAAAPAPSARRVLAGFAAGIAALFAMGPGALVPVSVLGLAALRLAERRRWADGVREAAPALVLLIVALVLRARVPDHASLAAPSAAVFLSAAIRVLAWPHAGGVVTALLMNLPLWVVVARRALRRRRARPGEDFVLVIGFWSTGVALATAWARGGSGELAGGVPSRYADLLVLLPLANLWCVVTLASELPGRWRRSAQLSAGAWAAFLLVGWAGLSAEMTQRVLLPRARDREAPVRLAQAFQQSRDPAVFAGQPRLLVPHPNPAVVQAVLDDERLRGHLPPSLQPGYARGPLSRWVRRLLGRQ